MDYSDILQDISVDLSYMIKKHLKNIKKLDSKKQKEFTKLFVDMKQGVDDLSEGVNESVNEAKYNYKQDAMNAYMNGKITAKELDQIAKKDFGSSVATKKELQSFLDSGYMKSLMANTYGLKVPAMEKKVKELMRFAEGTLKEDIQYFESLDERKSMDMKKRLKVYDKLKKGDKITIKYGSSMRGGVEKEFVVSKGKTLVGKQKVERIILQNPANPKGVKYYLYQRNGNVTMAIGDMAATIEDMHESIEEGVKKVSARDLTKVIKKKKLKGMDLPMFKVIGGTLKHYPFGSEVKPNPKAEYIRATSSEEAAKRYTDIRDNMVMSSELDDDRWVGIHMNESVNEASEPEIITQLRKGGYQTLKDPQTGKKHKVDNYSASAIVAVYDALKKDKVKEKFVNLPLPKMVNVAFKAMK